jgi:hypothetical protein
MPGGCSRFLWREGRSLRAEWRQEIAESLVARSCCSVAPADSRGKSVSHFDMSQMESFPRCQDNRSWRLPRDKAGAMRQRALSLLAACGLFQVGLGVYFIALRPPMLPEDERFTGLSLEMIASPAIPVWLDRVFVVLGGHATHGPFGHAGGRPVVAPERVPHGADSDRRRRVRRSDERNELCNQLRLPMVAACAGPE